MTQDALYILYALLAAGAAGLYLSLPNPRPDARRYPFAGAILGAAGLYLSLPNPRPDARRYPFAGAILGAAALAALAVGLMRWLGPGCEGRGFLVIFAVLAVAAAVRVITHPQPVYSAAYFILVVLAVTGLCILAAAEFLGAALVIIYGGAILVTYIFVIMLAQQPPSSYDRQSFEPLAAVLIGFLLTAAVGQALAAGDPIAAQAGHPRAGYHQAVERPAEYPADAGAVGNTRAVGRMLMTTYVMAVEIAGVLLLVAVVGAIAVTRKRIDPEALTDDERRRLETREDLHRRGREAVPF